MVTNIIILDSNIPIKSNNDKEKEKIILHNLNY
jgi:hypothetical protein